MGRSKHESTAKKCAELAAKIGMEATAKKLGIKYETARRYVRKYKNENGLSKKPFDEKLIEQLNERFTPAELKRLLSSSHFSKVAGKNIKQSFDGDTVIIGAITDSHLGSIYTDVDMINKAFDMFAKRSVDFIVHTGDVFEGLSSRAGHCYECSHLGYSAQLNHGRDVFSQWTDTKIYMVDGNHDRWYIQSNGAVIVEELAMGQENIVFLGHDEGDIDLGSVRIKLWHGLDGNSYAYSYRVQKIVESLTGGEKPDVLLVGHTHKAFYIYDRHIHCVSCASLQKQSKWMRGKRAQSHTGFWIIKITVNDTGVAHFAPEFFPFYE